MCPIETPEGPNIGLIGGLSTYARVNAVGFIESPYRHVRDGHVTDDIIWLTADEEEDYVVAQANEPLTADHRFKNDRILVRRSPQATTLENLRLQLERDTYFAATTEISAVPRSEEHTSELQSLMRISYAVFCLNK